MKLITQMLAYHGNLAIQPDPSHHVELQYGGGFHWDLLVQL